MRLLRVRRTVATLCWATVWAVLLSVQLHPRQPVGQRDTKGAEAGGGGVLLTFRASPSPRGLQRNPFLPQEPGGTGWGRRGAGVGRGGQGQEAGLSLGVPPVPGMQG